MRAISELFCFNSYAIRRNMFLNNITTTTTTGSSILREVVRIRCSVRLPCKCAW